MFFCLVTKFSNFPGLWFTESPKKMKKNKTHEADRTFPGSLCSGWRFCLIIPHMKGPASTMCVIMLAHWVPLPTKRHQALRFFRISSPGLLNMAVSVTLAHTRARGHPLPQADISYPPALACRQWTQNSSFLLSTEGPAWCAAWE